MPFMPGHALGHPSLAPGARPQGKLPHSAHEGKMLPLIGKPLTQVRPLANPHFGPERSRIASWRMAYSGAKSSNRIEDPGLSRLAQVSDFSPDSSSLLNRFSLKSPKSHSASH